MKPRRAMVRLEVTTDVPLRALRAHDSWVGSGRRLPRGYAFQLHQIQVNVITHEPEKWTKAGLAYLGEAHGFQKKKRRARKKA